MMTASSAMGYTLKDFGNASSEDVLAVPKGHWAKTLSELVDVLSAHFNRAGKHSEDAFKEASLVTVKIARHFGGRHFYLPQGKALQIALRHEEIFRLNNGRNARELAEKYGITVRMVQMIVAQQSELQRKKRQGLT